jgi:hypothetical protein
MALADWMIPTLSLSAEAQLIHNKRTLEVHGPADMERTIRLTCSLLEQNALQESIIRKATGHIAELELYILLNCNKRRPSLLERLRKFLSTNHFAHRA